MLNTSSAGGKKRGADAAANKWMYESSVYILSKVRPKVLWGENAPGLFTVMGEGVIEKLRKIGEHFGYSFSVMKTSTELHGIPQVELLDWTISPKYCRFTKKQQFTWRSVLSVLSY